jgi:hypothetical protein
MAVTGTRGSRTRACLIRAIHKAAVLQRVQQPSERNDRFGIRHIPTSCFSEFVTGGCKATGVLGDMPGNQRIQILNGLVPSGATTEGIP